ARPDGVVHQGPLVARAAHQPHPHAGFDPGGDQTAGDLDDLVAELAAGDVLPAGVPASDELHRVRRVPGVVPHRVGEVDVLADHRDRRYGELAHHSNATVSDVARS